MSPSALALGRYQLQEQIAAGGMGEVWRGVDTVLERSVAVKVLRGEHAQHRPAVARFRCEARHAASVSHPAIASIHDYGEAGPFRIPYLVMELVDGPSLAALLSAGRLDAAHAMDVIAQAAAGLHAAHAAGLVHRDIKPANMLLDRQGHVKITDFGIADIAGSAPSVAGKIVGTPGYLAPERMSGAPATPASDLYSLGVVAYECLAGQPPFSGTPSVIASAHRDCPLPPLPPTVPADVAELVANLTAKDPGERPASARDVAAWASRLRDALPGGSVGVESQATGAASPTLAEVPLPGTAASRSGTWQARGQRRLVVLPLAIAVVVMLATVLGLLAGRLLATSDNSSPLAPNLAARVVNVDGAAYVGQPVRVADSWLRHLGFVVRVNWRHAGQVPAGTVLSVGPDGQVRAGSTITVTGALPPGGWYSGQNDDHHSGGQSG